MPTAPCAAAKWGVVGFTQSLAKKLGPANIRVAHKQKADRDIGK
jgi:NAD(P)-dependent dehydrogenase (short-subunit alcohol dehydrogenase family)